MSSFEDLKSLYRDELAAGYAYIVVSKHTIGLLDVHLERNRLRGSRDINETGLPLGFFDELAVHAKLLESICLEVGTSPVSLLEHIGIEATIVEMYWHLGQHAINLLNMKDTYNE